MNIDLSNKRFVILGLQGSGKSVLVKDIINQERNHLIYDVHHEHNGCNRYLVENRRVKNPGKDTDPAMVELNNFVDIAVFRSKAVRMFILEEANRFCPNHYPLPGSILTLNDDNRHDRIAFGSVARRASQLNTDLVELAHYLFIFRLPGRNDYRFLEDTAEGLGDAVRGLRDFHFIVVNPDRTYEIHKPVKLQE